MGTGTLATKNPGDVVASGDPNQYKSALGADMVPRNTSGVPTTRAGSIGTETYLWERANVKVGHLFAGQVIMFHDFNGALSPGRGWMKCNGDIVNETNYDAIHGAGTWDVDIGTSPLDGKYLPNMNNKFPVGATNTTQAGTVAITFEGNASHQISIAHTHTVASHGHQWLSSGGSTGLVDSGSPNFNSGVGNMRSYDSSGTLVNFSNIGYTDKQTPATDSMLSATQSIKPESCAFEFWIRII